MLLKEAQGLLVVTTKTLQKWDREGKIKMVRTLGGRRRVPCSEIERLRGISPKNPQITGYARVSSVSQKAELQTQIQLLQQNRIDNIFPDMGSGKL